MVMIGWIDTIIAFLVVSSALLLVLGALSYLVMRLLKIRGKPNLWICTMLMLMPFIYPLHTLLPDVVRVTVPIPAVTSPAPKPVVAGTTETIHLEVSIGQKSSLTASARATIGNAVSTSTRPAPWKLLVASAWILPLLFFLFRSLLMAYRTRCLSRHAEPVNDPAALELLRQCAAETGVRKVPELKRTNPLSTPMVMGFLRPSILLPEHLLTAPFQEGLRFTLLHELKHLKRRDNWWLLVESAVGAVYFFHPVIHWARKRIHEEWEYLCDHHVIRVTRKSASYADFLLHEVWNHGPGSQRPATVVPFIVPGASKTARRVRAILENNTSTLFTKIRGSLAVGVVFVSLLSLLALTAAPSVREETASAASIDTRLTALPEETVSVPAVTETETMTKQPPTVETAHVPTLQPSTPSLSSIASSQAAGEIHQATSTVPADSSGIATEAVETVAAAASGIAVESNVSATSPTPSPTITRDVVLPTPQDVEILQESAVSPVPPMLLAENDAPQPEEKAPAVKTASTVSDTATDKYSYLDNQLEEVSDISSFNMTRWNWQTVDNRSFILQTSPRRYYLILLRRSARGLMFTENISISSFGSKVKPGELVTVFGPLQGVYIIQKIYKLKDRKTATEIRNHLS